MSMRVALTGATGFVGKAVLQELVAQGFEVSVLVRSATAFPLQEGVRVVRGSLSDQSALLDLTAGAEVVVHLAGLVSAVSREDFMQGNVFGTAALSKAAKRNGVRRFVYMSSLAAREPELNPYAMSKFSAEVTLQALAKDFELVVLRPSAVYGPGDKATLPLLQALLGRLALLPGTATARFNMVHVEDLADVVLAAIAGSAVGTFDVDDGGVDGHSWPELISITRATFGLPAKVIYLPRAVAFALGRLGDLIGRMTGKPFLVNSIAAEAALS